MPLNGSDVASKPTGTTATPNTTIESAKYNSTVDDIYSILNTVRTVAKGYTGATNAADARTNLGIARYETKAAAEAASIIAEVKALQLQGRTTGGDGGEALYKRVDALPSHAHYFRSTDRFLSNGTTDATNGGYWELVSLLVSPVALGQVMGGTPRSNPSVIVGGFGNWHVDGDLVARPAWTVNVTFPTNAVSSYDLDLTGHFIDPVATSAIILGGQSSYYSSVGPDAHLSITKGGDNRNLHISGLLLSDHSDLLKDNGGFSIGDHGTILGGAFHQAAGTMVAIVGGEETKNYGSYSFMGGGFNNTIGVPATDAAGDHVMNGMIGGSENDCRGKYNAFAGGLSNTTTTTTRFAAVIGGWNNTLGDASSRDGLAAIGGQDNTIVGSYSAAIAGITNTVTPTHAVALGGNNNTINSTGLRAVVMGQRAVAKAQASFVQASGRFAADGDAQIERIHFFGTGTASIPISVANLGSGIRTLASGEVCGFVAYITGARTDVVGEYWRYRIDGLIKNEAGTVAIAGTPVRTDIFESDAAFTATAVVLGGTTLGITITGDAGKTTRWTGHVELDTTSMV